MVIKHKLNFINKNIFNISFIIKLFFIFIPISVSEDDLRKLNSKNEITLRIKKSDKPVQFLENNIIKPDQLIINGKIIEDIKINYEFTEADDNIVVIKWNSPLTTCQSMFYNLNKIIFIDFSKFDSSKVDNMVAMFYGCESLTSINFNNFDTSLVTSMERMFCKCKSLISLNLSSFNTILVSSMRNMFSECASLISIDLSSFDTTLVIDMDEMFKDDSLLISLDLSNFNTISLKSMKSIFYGCKSLVYINLISFIDYNYILVDNILSNDLDKIILCYDEKKADRIYRSIKNINTNNYCNNTCFSESKKIIVEKKICIDDCSKDETYIYEYNNLCYDYEKTKQNINSSENIENTKITEKNEDSVIITNNEKIEIIEKTELDGINEKSDINKKTQNIEKTEIIEKFEISEKLKLHKILK